MLLYNTYACYHISWVFTNINLYDDDDGGSGV